VHKAKKIGQNSLHITTITITAMKLLKVITISTLLVAAGSAQGQVLRDYMNDAGRILGGKKSKGDDKTITNTEIVAGLKEALNLGSKTATNKLSIRDGFFGSAAVKILMPPEARRVETTLRQIGMGNYVDKAILSMNRAAEDAAKQALPIFENAVRTMTIIDALSILRGNDDAATQYLKDKTTQQLTASFRPIVGSSLDKVNATKYWAEVFEVYNALPTTNNKINPDLSAYVTERAIAGVFVYVAQEEAKIRQNPAARVSDLLKKVFSRTKG
jgi:hypothetical protein